MWHYTWVLNTAIRRLGPTNAGRNKDAGQQERTDNDPTRLKVDVGSKTEHTFQVLTKIFETIDPHIGDHLEDSN